MLKALDVKAINMSIIDILRPLSGFENLGPLLDMPASRRDAPVPERITKTPERAASQMTGMLDCRASDGIRLNNCD